MNVRLLTASALVLAAASATAAHAQDDYYARNRNTSVRERPRPDYEALGLGTGGIRVLPKATVTVTQDDNIFANDVLPIDDTIISTMAEVNLISDWNVHSLTALARVRNDNYLDTDTQNQTVYNLAASGRLDATRNVNFTGGANYDSQVEPRTASGNPLNSIDPIEYSITGFNAGAEVTFNRLRLRGNVSDAEFDYDNGRSFTGAVIDQSYRDESILRGTLRGDYAVSPDTSLFLEGAFDQRDFDQKGSSAVIRDSDGWEFNAGADFDITNLIRGSVQAGYLEHHFDDPTVPDSNSFSGRVAVEWFPTELATVSLRASRTVEDTGVITSPGFLSSNYSAQMDYELLRNLIVTGRVSYGKDSYKGITREDERNQASLGAVWLVNRHVGVSGNYTYLRQNSSGAGSGPDYDIHRISASLTLQY